MPEATMICCDCSEWMRNGDLIPNRFDSQIDAVGQISSNKTEFNHENTVGLISMGNNGKAEVLVNCTSDVGRVLSSLSKMKISGEINILVALQTAQLALKHRKNKKQDQHIILFIGSPIKCNEKLLIKSGKRLKKNNVSVDIISFGEINENKTLLESFINAVKSNDNSHLVFIDENKLISNEIKNTPILSSNAGAGGMGGGGGMSEEAQIAAATAASMNSAANDGTGANAANGGAAGGGGGFDEFGGIDPNMDPELAMALRMSLQEERQRQREQEQATNDNNNNNNNDNAAEAPAADASGASGTDATAASGGSEAQEVPPVGGNGGGGDNDNDDEDIDMEDQELMAALQMSLMVDDDDANNNNNNNDAAAAGNDENKTDNNNNGDGNDELDENEMIDDLLSGLPGLNEDDINDLLDDNNKDNDNDKDKDKDKDKS